MLGPAASYYWGWEKIRLRINLSGRLPVGFEDSTIDDDPGLNMLSLQPTLEFPISGPFEVGVGLAGHRLGGDHDAVYHLSIPVFGQLRLPVGTSGNWFFRIGLGGHYFPSFDAEDFDGGKVKVETDGGEFTPGVILGLDYRRN